ncbi:USP54_2 [Blepharisma stoltei]|uniref:USP domain-containing protein n=1 Tax=Blepharisma stoltei TaxID=1481888 RepID=A0AAU9JLA3_9CILI|nr:unnamed protein product [Blepharisma stoltei]
MDLDITIQPKGLKNRGENNCFLNVILQSLWNIEVLRNQLMSQTRHVHEKSFFEESEDQNLCLKCEIEHLMVEIQFSESKSIPSTTVRRALSQLTSKFQDRAMACAVEAFEEILMYIHRESVSNSICINSSSIYIKDQLNSTICNPPCISHANFTLQTIDEYFCCGKDRTAHIQNEFFLRIYVSELEAQYQIFAKINEKVLPDLDILIGEAVREDLMVNCYNTCDECCQKVEIKRRWITTPRVLALYLIWNSDVSFSKTLLTCLRHELRTSVIFSADADQEIYRTYTLKGLICYKEYHYVSFYYSPIFNKWYKTDDSSIQKIDSWSKVLSKINRNGFQPIILFYEAAAENSIFLADSNESAQAPHVEGEGISKGYFDSCSTF